MIASPLDPYFQAVDAGDASAATAAFAEGALYIRPSLEVPGSLEVARGHDELLAFFRKRGKLPVRHDVRACVVDGLRCFVEGVAIVDGNPIRSFLVHATLDDNGLITRYFALMADLPSDLEPLHA